MPSTVNPNFSSSTSPGAEAPKQSIPMVSPEAPTYLCQPNVAAASTDTLAVTPGGRTVFRYSTGCFSNSSQERILTTLVFTPSFINISEPLSVWCTSEPVEINIRSGVPGVDSSKIYAPHLRPSAEEYLVRS